ncbi:hypothetical protein BGZ60DRAFT_523685 [Tricladium varicosporioides]|nr:hypothetical protein BGZ60DRAFT_523685 [Hymenoscyphus varicosporioides]
MNDSHLPRDASSRAISLPPEFWFMFASLCRANIYNAIEKHLGRGPIAQSKVSQLFSQAPDDHHWVDEVERLVATLHTRMRINIWSITIGEDSKHKGEDGSTWITPEDRYGNSYRMLKYNPPGYTSIRHLGFLLILFSPPSFTILSWKWPLWFWTRNPLKFRGDEQGESKVQPAAAAAIDPRPSIGKTMTAALDVAGPSGSTSVNLLPDYAK